jgi:MYXO-CTERM domain-containing protein
MTDGSATGCSCDAGPHDRAPRSLLITFGVAMFVLRRGRGSCVRASPRNRRRVEADIFWTGFRDRRDCALLGVSRLEVPHA